MKIGNITIKKAYLGGKELTSSNAFLGTIQVIGDTTPFSGLCLTALEDSTVEIIQEGTPEVYTTYDLKYSLNGVEWNDYTLDTVLSLTAGEKLYWKGYNVSMGELNSIHKTFVMTGSLAASGNIMSLLGTDTLADYAFCGLFYGCSALTTAPELPATTLADNCYRSMFRGTSITTAPALPATTLAEYCYFNMFVGSTLTTAPELPATNLAEGCYYAMFQDCTGLTSAPVLPATTLALKCYHNMFYKCTALTTAPELPATELADYCYRSIFENCTSLTTAPSSLPATKMYPYCYTSMFYKCSSLETVSFTLPATELAEYCYANMFKLAPKLIKAPALPATTLVDYCYSNMFNSCSSLNYIKCLATDISATKCLDIWTKDVASSGTFVKNAAMSSWTTGTSGIPSGWTVEDAS